MNQKVILISGTQMRVGKSTLAKCLFKYITSQLISNEEDSTRHTLPQIGMTRRYAFASPIKEIARNYLFWDGETKGDDERRMFQHLGTEVGRAYFEDVWVEHFNKLLEADYHAEESFMSGTKDFTNIYIVDDWRFQNEESAIRFEDKGGIFTIRVDRDVQNPDSHTSHASENGLPNDPEYYDFFFENNYPTIEDLEQSEQFEVLMDELVEFFEE